MSQQLIGVEEVTPPVHFTFRETDSPVLHILTSAYSRLTVQADKPRNPKEETYYAVAWANNGLKMRRCKVCARLIRDRRTTWYQSRNARSMYQCPSSLRIAPCPIMGGTSGRVALTLWHLLLHNRAITYNLDTEALLSAKRNATRTSIPRTRDRSVNMTTSLACIFEHEA
ncbi:hypothetical protein GOBAR_AA24588 [Gossypium barbadense]|uniref:Uncharacterized protein n=1 Tax=Gossypium barbadense TaxID=3634 RepID=A0A2P5WYD2_GOSBA|nr:hypothetical protein GOBAR_AA24588 [Gossypium barbadense]